MKPLRLALLLAVLSALALACAQNPSSSPTNKAIDGVWRGQMNGLPAIDLVLSDEGGTLAGAVLFYFQMRKTVDDPYIATPGLPEPLFNLRWDGKTLTFQMSHRRAHPPRTLSDPPVSFRLTLIGADKAELVNENEGGANQKGPPFVLTRSDF